MIIKQFKDLTTNSWYGGTTTEYFIYPLGSSFKASNYKFRLSLATIEIETSVFTILPNIERRFMLLDGQIELDHKNHHTIKVSKYEQDAFNGSWHTNSKGTGTAFNLMMQTEVEGALHLIKSKQDLDHCTQKHNYAHYAFFVIEGQLQYGKFTAQAKSMLVVDDEFDLNNLKMENDSKIVFVGV